jgi:hypothetical protein
MSKSPKLHSNIASKKVKLSLPSSALPFDEISDSLSPDSTDSGRSRHVGTDIAASQASIWSFPAIDHRQLKPSVHDVAAYITSAARRDDRHEVAKACLLLPSLVACLG